VVALAQPTFSTVCSDKWWVRARRPITGRVMPCRKWRVAGLRLTQHQQPDFFTAAGSVAPSRQGLRLLKILMPRRILWVETSISVGPDTADAVLESLCRSTVFKSKPSKGTACLGEETHKSRYRLLEAAPTPAMTPVSSIKCTSRWRMTYLEMNLVSVYEFGQHTRDVSSPQRKKLTTAQKLFCRELAEHH
jgi:hypothetical protein